MPPTFRQQDVQTPHFRIPFQLNGPGSHAMYNEQDSDEDIIDCVRMVLAYPIGAREDIPAFGYPELLFSQLNTSEIVGKLSSAVRRWETRADIDVHIVPVIDDAYVQQLRLEGRGGTHS